MIKRQVGIGLSACTAVGDSILKSQVDMGQSAQPESSVWGAWGRGRTLPRRTPLGQPGRNSVLRWFGEAPALLCASLEKQQGLEEKQAVEERYQAVLVW